jgi:hypothetical protein
MPTPSGTPWRYEVAAIRRTQGPRGDRQPPGLPAGPPSSLVHTSEYVSHPRPELPMLIAPPPSDRQSAIVVRSHLACRVQVVLEPSRPCEREGAIGDLAFISVAVFGERPIVAEEDDAKLPGCSVMKPVIDAPLGALVAKYGS